jgi:hypothetical protein
MFSSRSVLEASAGEEEGLELGEDDVEAFDVDDCLFR